MEFLWDGATLSAIQVTFTLAICATGISALLGIWLGLKLERHQFKGKSLVIRINRTLMGVPPVVVGLLTYMLLMRNGPLGFLSLLFTLPGMIIAQTIIITPIICGTVYASAERQAPAIRFFGQCIGASPRQTQSLVRRELKREIYFAIITGFGRSISEVGAVMLVGGNMKYHTRTMTTAISLLKSQGIFTEGITLGVVLLLMAFLLQWGADFLQRDKREIDNY
ncbi:tungstate transport system permease protein [Eubacterium aggregans]|uniref:Tungstate transport system permease protein n=2 Tax=Eubacterium aggregans TaxID=81409 RepID=A0A1H4BI23_9FIRM|nr:ABC transporter permease [Eubacterium aggregans]SEA47757.1 tungstate transport system permease protein [Eubacterium aggregans]